MAMLYEVIFDGRYQGSQVIQKYNFHLSGATAAVNGSFALVSALGAIAQNNNLPAGQFVSTMLGGLVNSYSLVKIIAQACGNYSPADFYVMPYPTPRTGNVQSGGEPPFVALKLKGSRVTRAIRGGVKSFSGIPDSVVENGTLSSQYISDHWLAIIGMLNEGVSYIDEGQTLTFRSATVSLQEYTEGGKKKRRYYPTYAEQMEHTALGSVWTVNPRVSSQNSRKDGQGS